MTSPTKPLTSGEQGCVELHFYRRASAYHLSHRSLMVLVDIYVSNKQLMACSPNRITFEQGNRRHQTSPPILPTMSHFEYTPWLRRLCLADYGRTWRHPQNRKYITFCNVEKNGAAAICNFVACTGNFVKFGRVVLKYASGHTDRQTDRQTRSSHLSLCQIVTASDGRVVTFRTSKRAWLCSV